MNDEMKIVKVSMRMRMEDMADLFVLVLFV